MIDWSRLVPPGERARQERALLRDRIRHARDRALAGGVAFDGVRFHTDDSGQGRITAAALAAMLDPGAVVNWKTMDGGFVALEAGRILAIARGVRAHVQACFDREAALLAALETGPVPDIESGWPG